MNCEKLLLAMLQMLTLPSFVQQRALYMSLFTTPVFGTPETRKPAGSRAERK